MRGWSGEWRTNEPMSRHVTWRAGGVAQGWYRPLDRADLINFLQARVSDQPLYPLGLGSNTLVRDKGLKATIVSLHGALMSVSIKCTAEGIWLDTEAGVPVPKIAKLVEQNGLTGAEFLAGIPGTVGGALAMNAGCYGSETWAYIISVTTVNQAGIVRRRTPADYHIGYRSVVLREELGDRDEWFIGAQWFFSREEKRGQARMRDMLEQRLAQQPLGQANAGSVFRNPEGDHAARLIEVCGLKGYHIGSAQVSWKHANFIINRSGASAAEIERLIFRVQERVACRFGIKLHPEVRIIGEGVL